MRSKTALRRRFVLKSIKNTLVELRYFFLAGVGNAMFFHEAGPAALRPPVDAEYVVAGGGFVTAEVLACRRHADHGDLAVRPVYLVMRDKMRVAVENQLRTMLAYDLLETADAVRRLCAGVAPWIGG